MQILYKLFFKNREFEVAYQLHLSMSFFVLLSSSRAEKFKFQNFQELWQTDRRTDGQKDRYIRWSRIKHHKTVLSCTTDTKIKNLKNKSFVSVSIKKTAKISIFLEETHHFNGSSVNFTTYLYFLFSSAIFNHESDCTIRNSLIKNASIFKAQ